jgi:hypothetical protein
MKQAERDALTGCCESLGLFRSTPCGRRGSYDGGLVLMVVVVVHWRFRQFDDSEDRMEEVGEIPIAPTNTWYPGKPDSPPPPRKGTC